MRLSLALLLLAPALSELVMPADAVAAGAYLNIKTALSGDKLIFWVQKTRPGYASFGFGKSMEKGDVAYVEFEKKGKLVVKDCQLKGYVDPDCGAAKLWVLEDHVINKDGSWLAKFSRDLKKDGGVAMSKVENDIIYSYSDLLKMKAHEGENSAYGVVKVAVGRGRRLLRRNGLGY